MKTNFTGVFFEKNTSGKGVNALFLKINYFGENSREGALFGPKIGVFWDWRPLHKWTLLPTPLAPGLF